MSTPRARGASTGAKRRAGGQEAQHHRIPPALRNRDAHDGGGQEPSSLSVFSSFLELSIDLIFHAMGYLDAESLAKLETVAKAFKRIATPHWKALDKQVPVGCRSSSSVPRTRAIRFHAASRFADLASEGRPISDYFDLWKEEFAYQRNLKPTFEYFVRFFDRNTDKVLAQGFTTGVSVPGTSGLILPMDKMDLSKWPALHALMPINFFEGRMKSVFRETGIVIVALKKTSRTPCLSLAFASREYDDTLNPYAIEGYKLMSYPRRGECGRLYDTVRSCTFPMGKGRRRLFHVSSSLAIALNDRANYSVARDSS